LFLINPDIESASIWQTISKFFFVSLPKKSCNSFIKNFSQSRTVFTTIDLTVDYTKESGCVLLEAFKLAQNDEIINETDTKTRVSTKHGKLMWSSIGNPKLIQPTESASSIFNFNSEGFYIKVEMLTEAHRNLFVDLIKDKYNITVKPRQIVNLVPSEFRCSVTFTIDGEQITIYGQANNLKNYPMRVDFPAALGLIERAALEKKIKNDGKKLDLEFKCELVKYYKDETFRQNFSLYTVTDVQSLPNTVVEKINYLENKVKEQKEQMQKLQSHLIAKVCLSVLFSTDYWIYFWTSEYITTGPSSG
jgi:hypothetical protein